MHGKSITFWVRMTVAPLEVASEKEENLENLENIENIENQETIENPIKRQEKINYISLLDDYN